MKNFKKLFIALPLVLVMLIMAVPVNAQDVTYKVEANTLGLKLQLDNKVVGQELKAETRNVPIWGAVKTYKADSDRVKEPSQGAGWYKLLNDGLPMAWREYSSLVATEFMIGKNAVETEPKFADYVLPTYQINHVEQVKTNIQVPATWTGVELGKVYKAAANSEAKVPAGTILKAGKNPEAIGEVTVDKEKLTATFDNQTVAVNEVVKVDVYTLTKGTADENKFTIAPAYTNPKDGNLKLEAGTEYAKEAILAAFTGDNYKEVENNIHVTTEGYKTAADLFAYKAGDVVEAKNVKQDVASKKYYGDVNGKSVEVTVETENDYFVNETLWGLLVIVEEKYVPVTINHHFIVEGSEEIIQTTNVKQEKGVALTANNIKAEWLMEVGEFKYDPTKTEVTEKTNTNQLVIGETIVESYVVDLFYTAGEANADEIDAAFANTNTGVANANVANLPATGAASNVALILSSAALAVVGLFLKK